MSEQKKDQKSEGKKPDDTQTPKRLFRSTSNKMIGGVCGGLAEYFAVDAIMIRVLWGAAVLFGGVGIVAYILCWIIIPADNAGSETVPQSKAPNSSLMWGSILVCVGLILLAGRFHFFRFSPFCFSWQFHPWWMWRQGMDLFLPIVIILIGVVYLFKVSTKDKHTQKKITSKTTGDQTMEKKLTRSVNDKMIAGVCGGLASYFAIDPSLVRIGFALACLVSGGIIGIIAYVAMMIIIPEETVVETPETGAKKSTSKTK